ncbi:LysR family transcriptional regulator (plasmid) [Paraburkholderia sp. PREW-6R]|uniref:LysR family transcriptional regulator n=1 Tax=Paraburkholderia sp. PREW-6R TaxID=3141544 RepID=UPI0031F54712
MDMMQGIQTFVAVADSGGFTAAAKRLCVGTPQVSRAIVDLETHLGARLINRTTRYVALTSIGERYLAHCRSILERLRLAEAEAASLCAQPAGTLRVGISPLFDRHHLLSVISGYLERFPEISVELVRGHANSDAHLQDCDVMLRCGAPSDSDHVLSRNLGAFGAVLCASPAYLARHGLPEAVDDLRRHRCLVLNDGSADPGQWSFETAEGRKSFKITSTPLQADLIETLEYAVLSGAGIGPVMLPRAAPALGSGNLVRVLSQHSFAQTNALVSYLAAHGSDAKVQTWVDFVAQQFPRLLAGDQKFMPGSSVAVVDVRGDMSSEQNDVSKPARVVTP